MPDNLMEAMVDMRDQEALDITGKMLEDGVDPMKILGDCSAAMEEVGKRFESGEYFLPQLMLAGEMLKQISAMVKPKLTGETEKKRLGKVLIGTVKGDIHDIGKNLVGMMMEGAGFEVINLGINTPVETYLAAIEEHKPDILGMSALLTTTMPYMKVVIDTLKSEGIRDNYIVMVGGAPLNDEFASAIGADAYCRDAATAVETAKKLVGQRRAEAA